MPTLAPGDRLGPYEILCRIGAGGMGEVWKARDTRLGREVAVKVSAEKFNDRFEREARAVATLNHPNICTLHDVGALPDGLGYLVMELIDGPTLAERIKADRTKADRTREIPLPLTDALAIASQIADALDAAHQKGIVHRDLKPTNIKVSENGTVKVLDFGLALMAAAAAPGVAPASAGDSNPSNSPTITELTRPGMILGTAAYMSPEQARGKTVDKRADIWAFGVVLYEMVAGTSLFKGEDLSETLAAVIKQEPDLTAAPVEVRKLLQSCLEKDPNKRLRDIGDWSKLLDPPSSPVRELGVNRGKWLLPLAAAMLMAVAALALWALWRTAQPVDRPLVRLDVDLGADVSLRAPTSEGSSVVISPDGTRLAYVSGRPTNVFTRGLDQPKATELPGTQGATIPFFSPDGQWVGFQIGGRLSKISVAGGTVVPLWEYGTNFAGAGWSEDGSIFVSRAFQMGLLRIPAGGGPPESVAALGNGEVGLYNPQILPGGKAVLFSVDRALGPDRNTIEILTLADPHRKVVARGGASPRYLATSSGIGHLIYMNKATMFAVPFDLAKLETRGTAVPVLDDVAYNALIGTGQFDFSPAPSGHGTFIYRRASGGAASAKMTLQWVYPDGGPTGKIEPLRAKPGVYTHPNLSLDGKRVTLTVIEGGSPDVWVYDPQRDAMTRLTFGGASYRWSTWSPDGQYVVFTSDGNGMFQARADGAGQPQPLTQGKPFQFPWSFTPDGKRLAYFEAAGNYQIWTVPLEDQGGQLKAGKPEQFLKSSFSDVFPSFSPDGRWLAYRANESGRAEVYVRAFPTPSSGQGGKWQISNSGGDFPHWSRNTHDLLYQSGDQIMAVSYAVKGDTFMAEKPRVWLSKLSGTEWDLAPDGKRVLVLTPAESVEAPQQEHEVVFLENFFDYLRQRVPVGK
jgi:serine/threonine protein kinase